MSLDLNLFLEISRKIAWLKFLQILDTLLDKKNLNEKINALIESVAPGTAHAEAIREIMLTALRLSDDYMTKSDAHVMHTALKEIRYGVKFFSAYKNVRKVSVFGSARTQPSEEVYQYSSEFSQQIASKGFMVITGAGDGIMRAAQEGAGREKSFGINILLPFEQSANEFIQDDPKLMTFNFFFTRKLFFVKEADAIALFPGGFGTHDEGYESLTLLQTGKTDPMPIVFVDVPGSSYWESWLDYINDELVERGLISPDDLNLFKVTHDIELAADEISDFYRNYHSSCYVDGKLILRVKDPITHLHLEQLNDHFSDIVVTGQIETSEPSPKETEALSPSTLYRIRFHFNQKNFGRLRKMIDMINQLDER